VYTRKADKRKPGLLANRTPASGVDRRGTPCDNVFMTEQERMGPSTPDRHTGEPDAYRNLNRAVLAVVCCALLVPLAGAWFHPMFYWLPACPSVSLFDRPCPLCGLTRGLGCLFRRRVAAACAYNPLSIPVLALLLAEIVWRIPASLLTFPPRPLAIIRRLDAGVHAAFLAGYLGYAAGFVLQGLF